MKNKNILLTLPFLLYTSILFATNNYITGTIKDAEGKPLAYSTVAIYKDSLIITGVSANKDGIFIIENLEKDNYTLAVSFVGYETVERNVNLQTSIDIGAVVLKESSTTLEDIKVVGELKLVSSDASKTTFEVTEAIKNRSKDVYDILQNIPNLTVNNLNKSIELDGQKNILILINGRKRDSNDLNSIDQKKIEKIEIMNNPPVRYLNDDISAVINVIVKRDKEHGFSGGVTGVADPGLLVQNLGLRRFTYNYGDVSLYSSLWINNNPRLSMESDITKTYLQEDGSIRKIERKPFGENMAYFNSTWTNAGLDFFITDKSLLNTEVSFWRSQDNLKFNQKGLETIDGNTINTFHTTDILHQNYNNLSYKLYYQYSNTKKGQTLVVDANYSVYGDNSDKKFETDTQGEVASIEQQLENAKQSGVLQVDYNQKINNLISIEAGNRSYYQYLEMEEENAARKNNLDYRDFQNYTYLGVSGELLDRFTYQLGAGYDYSGTTLDTATYTYHNFLQSVNLQYKPHTNHNINAGYSKKRKNPSVNNINPYARYIDSTYIEQGNPEVTPYFINQLKLSYSFSKGKIYVSPQTSFNFIDGVIGKRGSLDDDGVYTATYDNIAEYRQLYSSLNVNLKLFEWWNLKVDGILNYEEYDDPVNNLHNSSSSWGTNAQSTWIYNQSLSLTFEYQKKVNNVMANGWSTQPQEVHVWLNWNISDNWNTTVGAAYLLGYKEKAYIEEPSYKEKRETTINGVPLILCIINYRFNIGKQGKRIERKIDNQEEQKTGGGF